jgi:preprotein translocase subunit Sec61beta
LARKIDELDPDAIVLMAVNVSLFLVICLELL